MALLLLDGVTSLLVAFKDLNSPDIWLLALGAFALASAVVLVTSRPVRSFLEFQRGGGVA